VIADRLRGAVGPAGGKTYVVRLAVQVGFALLVLLVGARFAWFAESTMAASTELSTRGPIVAGVALEGLPERPAGVEAFLPISGLMGLADWIHQGQLNRVHPAATVLLLLFVALAVVGRKAFCSWVCPIGLLSEMLARAGRRIGGRTLRPWRWLDVPARGLKYLILAFFVAAVLSMDPAAIRSFIESPYNRVADVKMYLFFAEPSGVTLLTLAALAIGSVAVSGLWCRYLCPYGALLGLFSWLSPLKVRRDEERCTSCGACDKACWARLPVSRKRSVASVECSGCLDCVASCQSRGALRFGTSGRDVGASAFGAAVVIFVVAGCLAARLMGIWDNDVSEAEYALLMIHIDAVGHM